MSHGPSIAVRNCDVNDRNSDALGEVSIISSDEAWPAQFAAERWRLLSLLGKSGPSLQHFDSTAVPNLKAKPIIDMIAPIVSLPIDDQLSGRLTEVCYVAFDAGFFTRAFLPPSR